MCQDICPRADDGEHDWQPYTFRDGRQGHKCTMCEWTTYPPDAAAQHNRTCPGCGKPFDLPLRHADDFSGLLPDPSAMDNNAPKRRWHLRCHQKRFYSAVGGSR